MKKFFLIIILSLYCSTSLADKYVGRGELKLHDFHIENFMDYLSSPPGQSPMVFMVIADEEGYSIWATFWYCPEGNCMTLSKPKAARQCVKAAEKWYKEKLYLECFIFAKRNVVKWDNEINTGQYKESRFKSKWSKSEVIEKLSELGFETYE